MRVKPPKDPRLNDGWRLQLARAFFLLSPAVSTQWLPGCVHIATDARCVENLAGLLEVKGLKSSSRSSWAGRYAGDFDSYRDHGPPRRQENCPVSPKELAQDMQALSMLSTLSLRRFAWYLSGAGDVSPFFENSDELGHDVGLG